MMLSAKALRPLFLSGLLSLLCSLPSPARADSVVSPCDQLGLEAAIAEGGTITFDCDGMIVITNTITISEDLTLDATGHSVTISGPGTTNAVRLFLVEPDVNFTLVNLKLINGLSTNGGAIFLDEGSILMASACVFSNNIAFGSNGVSGASAPTNSVVANGPDGHNGTSGLTACGGAVFNLGTACFTACSFLTNIVAGGQGGSGGNGGNGLFTGGDGGSGGRGGSALGGAIYNLGEIAVTNCNFNSNEAVGGDAGAGGNGGNAPFPGVNGRGGSAGASSGAAIFNHKASRSTIISSTFALNGAASGDSANAGGGSGRGRRGSNGPHSSGGAIANFGTNVIVNCTFFANAAIGGGGGQGGPSKFEGGRGGTGGSAWGGNVFNGGKTARLMATNCTFSDGGAIGGTNGLGGSGPFVGKNGTRGASRGGNIAGSNGVFYLKNCIMAYPSAGTNGYGKLTDTGFNLSSDRSIKLNRKMGSITNTDPRLDILRDNGGPVQTLELLSDSPAIDAGDTNFCLVSDARGVARPLGNRCDLGAYEAGQRLLAPQIVSQPSNQVAQEGGSATFRVVATGDPPLSYQWQLRTVGGSFQEIDGATSSSYTVTDASSADEGEYEVIVSNNSGSTNSAAATFTVVSPPTITDQPQEVSLDQGENFTLSVTADGDEPLEYHWLTNGVSIPGALLSTYSVVGAAAKDDADYQVVVCNPYACVTSDVAHVTVNTLMVPPAIRQQPVSVNGYTGDNVTFAVTAVGLSLSYQWFFNATNPLPGATSRTLTLSNAQLTNNGTYRVVVTNVLGSATSAPASLNLTNSAPIITLHPSDASAVVGSNVTFSVSVVGSKPFLYQWIFTDQSLTAPTNSTVNLTNSVSGSLLRITTSSTGSSLTITLVPPASGMPYMVADEGVYQVNVFNPVGSSLSNEALLDVLGFGVGN